MRGRVGMGAVMGGLLGLVLPALLVRAAGPGYVHEAAILAFGLNLLVMAAIVFGFGAAITGQALGVTLSPYNDYSLSKLQMALWTVVVLAALLTVAEIRVRGLFGPCDDPLDISIPGTLLAAMGISAFTTAATPAILAIKATERADGDMARVAFTRIAARGRAQGAFCVGKVLARLDGEGAILADLVTGDEVANAATVDLTKVQQLLITLLLLGTYMATVVHMLGHAEIRTIAGITPETAALIDMAQNGAALAAVHVGGVAGLPDLSPSFVELLALSHAGYLAYKAVPKSGSSAPGREGMAREVAGARMMSFAAAPAPSAPAPTIPIRVAIAAPEAISGLVLRCDGAVVGVDEGGFAELALTPARHSLVAEGMRDGRPVRAEMELSPGWDDYNRPVALELR